MARAAITLSLLLLSACCVQRTVVQPRCAPLGDEPCGTCTQADALSPAAKAHLSIDAHTALLLAEVERSLLTGEARRPNERRFFVSDTGERVFPRVEGMARSPGTEAERALARANDGMWILDVLLASRRYSGHDGVLVDVRTTWRRWTASDDWLFEEQFNAIYCVVRQPDGQLRIERVGEDLWPLPVSSL